MTDDGILWGDAYDPENPDDKNHKQYHGECPSCLQRYTVIPSLEAIFMDNEAPLPEGDTVRPPEYCICSCGCHLWLVAVPAYRVASLGPIDPV